LCMMTEYWHGAVKCIRLVTGIKVVSEFLNREDANEDETGHARLASLDVVEKGLLANEMKFKEYVKREASSMLVRAAPSRKVKRAANDAQAAAALNQALVAEQARMQQILNNAKTLAN
jgi:hypothetical protein